MATEGRHRAGVGHGNPSRRRASTKAAAPLSPSESIDVELEFIRSSLLRSRSRHAACLRAHEAHLRSGMPGIEHHRRALERRLAVLESRLAGAGRKPRAEGEIGRAERAAAHARRVLAGFRREAQLREARAGEPLARRARRHFTRDSPLLLRLKLCWELERALCNMDRLLGHEAAAELHHDDEHGAPPERDRPEMPGGRDDDAGKEAVVQALLDARRGQRVLLLIVAAGGSSGKSPLAVTVLEDPRVRRHFEERSWRRASRELEAAAVVRSVALDTLRQHDLRSGGAPPGAPGGEVAGRRRRSLLVVDGAWGDEEQRKWEETLKLIPCLGAPGGMVVVTTSRRRRGI